MDVALSAISGLIGILVGGTIAALVGLWRRVLAARIAAEAKGGEILMANVVRELAEGKDFLFVDRGETLLRGFEEPVRLYEVRWQE